MIKKFTNNFNNLLKDNNSKYSIINFLFIFCLTLNIFFWDVKLKIFNNLTFSLREFIYFMFLYIIFIYTKKYIQYYFFFLIIFIFHSFYLNNYFFSQVDLKQNILGIFFVCSMILICFVFQKKITSNLRISFILFVYFFIFTLLFSNLTKIPNTYDIQTCNILKYKLENNLIFLEPSHLGMIFIPFIYFFFLSKEKISYINTVTLLFLSVFLFLFFYSLTLIFSLIISLLVTLIINYRALFKKKFFLFLQLIFIIIPLIFSKTCLYKANNLINYNSKNFFFDYKKSNSPILDYNYPESSVLDYKTKLSKNDLLVLSETKTAEEINILIKKNISDMPLSNTSLYKDHTTAVLINSFKILIFSIQEKPFGWGLNNYKFAFNKYMLKYIDPPYPEIYYLNYNDASNNFVKLIVEFGFISLIVFINLLIFLFNKNILYQERILLSSIIFTQMARGAGYFNGGFLLFLIMTFVLNLYSFKNNNG